MSAPTLFPAPKALCGCPHCLTHKPPFTKCGCGHCQRNAAAYRKWRRETDR